MAVMLGPDDEAALVKADTRGDVASLLDDLVKATGWGRWERPFPYSVVTDPVGRSAARYPWRQWLNGALWLAVRTTDYPCTSIRFTSYVHQRTNARGWRAVIRYTDDCVAFRMTDVPVAVGASNVSHLPSGYLAAS